MFETLVHEAKELVVRLRRIENRPISEVSEHDSITTDDIGALYNACKIAVQKTFGSESEELAKWEESLKQAYRDRIVRPEYEVSNHINAINELIGVLREFGIVSKFDKSSVDENTAKTPTEQKHLLFKTIDFFAKHQIWGALATLALISSIGLASKNFLFPPTDPDLVAIRALLIDVVKETEPLVYFGRSTDQDIESIVGGENGWTSGAVSRISRVQDFVSTVNSHDGFPKLSDQARKVFGGATSRLENNKNRSHITSRRGAIRQEACALIQTSLREVAIIDSYDLDEKCSGENILVCSDQERITDKAMRHQFAISIGVSSANC